MNLSQMIISSFTTAASMLVIALIYIVILFRGLIAGALGRRMSVGKANVIQALIFLAPHRLLLLVLPKVVALLMVGILGLGLLTGWLRLRSGSIGPGLLIHGIGNAFVGILAAMSPTSG